MSEEAHHPQEEIAQAWDQEIERRIAAFKAGTTQTYDLEEVLEEARRIAA